MTDAKKFYGSAYTADRAAKLEAACRYLDMALRAEVAGETNKIDMAFRAALKNEAEAFS